MEAEEKVEPTQPTPTEQLMAQYEVEEPAPVPAEKKPEEAKPQVSKQGPTEPPEEEVSVSEETAEYARELGLSDKMIEKLATAGMLEEALTELERTALVAAKSPMPAKADLVVTPGKEKGAEQKTEPTEKGFTLGLDPEVHDPDLIQGLEKMGKGLFDDLQAVKKQVSDLVLAQTAAKQQQFVMDYDNWIASLSEDWQKVLGSNPGEKLAEDSPEYINRKKHLSMMDDLAGVFSKRGARISEEALRVRALHLVWPEIAETLTSAKVRDALRSRGGRYAPRPSGRTGKSAETPEQRALTTIREKLDRADAGTAPENPQDDFPE